MIAKYLLCHGFGFTNEYWKNLVPLLNGEVVFYEKDFRADPNASYIGVGHSLGVQRLNNSGIEFEFLVGLQGFVDYCGSEPLERKKREESIDAMVKYFETDARYALKKFYEACQCDLPIPENVVAEELIADLLELKKTYKHCGCPMLVIGSDTDEIVPLSIVKDNFSKIPNVVVEEINGVPHSLGFAKAKEVVEKIAEFKKRLNA